MMGTTHQLVALLAAFWILTSYPVSVGWVVAVIMIMAVMVGALTPDLDQPAANLWRRMLAGRAIGNIFQAFSGGHRHMTHSIIGIVAVGYLMRWLMLELLKVDFHDEAMHVWRAFMVGYISHPIADTLTDQGVPWFWPLNIKIKIPPGPEELRVTTESLVEKVIMRGGIVIAFVILLRSHWEIFLHFFR